MGITGGISDCCHVLACFTENDLAPEKRFWNPKEIPFVPSFFLSMDVDSMLEQTLKGRDEGRDGLLHIWW